MSQAHSHSGLFFLCCGFHRSGTSLVAQSLAKSGLHMGDELMGASFSNPLGHVEDMPVVRLHDKIFAINGHDWRYCDNGPLIKPSWFSKYIEKYIDEKLEQYEIAAVKDPRAVFYLKDWQLAGKDNLRYVFVYRHWSTAVNSILNRASRHLINGSHPIDANKINFNFFAESELAFEMWRCTNKHLLDFYRNNKDKCLLISQEGFVLKNDTARTLTEKIGLPALALNNQGYRPDLMTNSVPASTLELVSHKTRAELENLWHQLEREADLCAGRSPDILQAPPTPEIEYWGISFREHEQQSASRGEETIPHKFDFSELSWEEALGFLVMLPEDLITPSHYLALFNRPFTGCFNYESLAKIAHGNRDYLFTKLAKMRAMQVDSGSWDIPRWQLYTEDDQTWWQHSDELLPNSNPFSLRPDSERAAVQPNNEIDVSEAGWSRLVDFIEQLPALTRNEWLTCVLLYRRFPGPGQYQLLAEIARRFNLPHIEEFALLKALRLDASWTHLVELGDLYRRQNMLEAALGCFLHVNKQEPERPAIQARVAEVYLQIDDIERAGSWLKLAEQRGPENRAVKVCRSRWNEKNANRKPRRRPPALRRIDKYVMPFLTNYQDVVELTRQDPVAGKRLDVHNQRMSFVLRDNKTWLTDALTQLTREAGLALSHQIYRQWQKVFNPEMVSAILPESSGQSSTMPDRVVSAWPEKKAIEAKLVVIIQVTELSRFEQAMAMLRLFPYEADLLVCAHQSLFEQVSRSLERYSAGQVEVSVLAEDSVVGDACFGDSGRLLEYDLVCYLHTLEGDEGAVSQSHFLQQLYGLLAHEDVLSNSLSRAIDNNYSGVILSPYHPGFAHHFVLPEELEKSQRLLQQLNSDIESVDFIYPQSGMFWYSPGLFSSEHEQPEQFGMDFGFRRAVSALALKQGLEICCTQHITQAD